MIITPDRKTTARLIDEAMAAGVRRTRACAALQISERTLRRWRQDMPAGEVHADRRPGALRPAPANKLSDEECADILSVCNSSEFASLPPSQIVPRLADQGCYIASESSFCRVLRAHGQQHHRGRSRAPRRFNPPTSYQATGPCQIWTRGHITWMPGPIAGSFFYLYLILGMPTKART
ncbi:helix-turn-helix domain-containing protein [Falsigemmobacter intermedius]|uniref:helix-turn-helix domain-containing protein n=1 Tax=Falsigemmobacter intermedius TaxID=1553448 RepID=UPI003F0EFB51